LLSDNHNSDEPDRAERNAIFFPSGEKLSSESSRVEVTIRVAGPDFLAAGPAVRQIFVSTCLSRKASRCVVSAVRFWEGRLLNASGRVSG